ncbi:MAG: 16S rRNA (adenine(1518)-N(6)/adenine(1519)-N(6))-dimethyltransferase RsmA [Bacteroidales bacterium]|nr:16S rRNA (adenine(1518)-N(6)/adenine(1519)-N(6))-dimethyltransferase RsmA [Bacteroidales bacterium]MCL2738142.1 16S rRNA (adenine(1518)-N(6)/adenine(1519)-N(6))-dimethyltransferase RsmA [Bacteroidales bacterium]
MYVQPKKALGQHFLKDMSVARRIVEAMCLADIPQGYDFKEHLPVLEVGPGMGVLTQFLLEQPQIDLRAIEIDKESVDYLLTHFPALNGRLIQADFLKMDLSAIFSSPFLVIGNFPYNISSQIFFKVLEERDRVPLVVGMLQKEVAERIAAPPGSKTYGILSVLLQTWYDIEYLCTVPQHVFLPPPKVQSAVVRLSRNARRALDCNEVLFKRVIKATFNQRRKAIRNSIKQLTGATPLLEQPLLGLRPEQLSVQQFIELTQWVDGLTLH